MVIAILRELLKGGSAPEDIGIISPYMGQVVALRSALYRAKLPSKMKRKRNSSDKKTVRRFPEVNTVDAFQGSEKDQNIKKKCGSITCIKQLNHSFPFSFILSGQRAPGQCAEDNYVKLIATTNTLNETLFRYLLVDR